MKNNTTIGFVPRSNTILVEHEIAKETKGGLKIPDHVQSVKAVVDVLAVGPEVKYCKVGDTIYFQTSGLRKPIIINDKEYVHLQEHEVIGVFVD